MMNNNQSTDWKIYLFKSCNKNKENFKGNEVTIPDKNYLSLFLNFSKFYNRQFIHDFSIIDINSLIKNISVIENIFIDTRSNSLSNRLNSDEVLSKIDNKYLRKLILQLMPFNQMTNLLSLEQKYILSFCKSILSNKKNIIFNLENNVLSRENQFLIKSIINNPSLELNKNIFLFSAENIYWIDIIDKFIIYKNNYEFKLQINPHQINEVKEIQIPNLKIAS